MIVAPEGDTSCLVKNLKLADQGSIPAFPPEKGWRIGRRVTGQRSRGTTAWCKALGTVRVPRVEYSRPGVLATTATSLHHACERRRQGVLTLQKMSKSHAMEGSWGVTLFQFLVL